MVEIPWEHHSYFPMNVDLLYMACLWAGSDIAAHYVHLGFALAVCGLLFAHLAPRRGRETALLGALFFLAVPAVLRCAASAYVDLGVTFFTTASLLAFLRFRKDGYQNILWLLASAVLMGLAAGSKHNALIVWCFLNLAMGVLVVRETRSPARAVGYMALFLTVSLLVVSPWFIRNALWTGNPIFPMFDSFFNPGAHGPSGEGGPGVGFFRKRGLMYGEPWWYTVLIPVRMFFSGRDDSDQFFDGVLCPTLLLLAPLAFLSRDDKTERGFFSVFSLFFIGIPLLMGMPRVRYIFPVLPALAILAAEGVKNLFARAGEEKRLPALALQALAVCASVHIVVTGGLYLAGQFEKIKPIPYLSGRESRDAFLSRHLANHAAVRYINSHSQKDAKVLLLFDRGRAYYLDREYVYEPSYGMRTTDELVAASKTRGGLAEYLRKRGITHLLVRLDLMDKYLTDNFTAAEADLFRGRLSEELHPAFFETGHAVYEANPLARPGAGGAAPVL
jgi:hypothetical protein